MSPGTSASSARAASSTDPERGRSAICPICETSNRPAAARVCRCSLMMPVGVLHRHVVAGERHHAGAEPHVQIVQRRAPELGCRRRRGSAMARALACRRRLRPWCGRTAQLARGLDLVEPPHRRLVRRALDQRGVAPRLLGDRPHRGDEGVERRLALGLGRLDHQRFRHDQREIVGRRMEAVVEQPLADVERAHAGAVESRPGRRTRACRCGRTAP